MKYSTIALIGGIMVSMLSLYLWLDNKEYEKALAMSPKEIIEEATFNKFQVVAKSKDSNEIKLASTAGISSDATYNTHSVSVYYGGNVHVVPVSEGYYMQAVEGQFVEGYYYSVTDTFILEYQQYK